LAVANRLDYAADQLGVPPERRRDLIVPSPFDWSRQARLLVASNAPDPRSPAYLPTLADFLYPLALVRHGRVLVLLTSYRAVQALSWTLREPLAAHGIRVLAQGEDGSPRLLVESFRQDPAAVLMGTASFWEGVDIPGTDLEIVVLGRLPFRAPGDPLEDARLERVAQRGGSAFLERTVPEAVIRFQQGFGRLIRTQRDRGVVVVFDPRVLPERTSYGRYFMASLPPIPWSARPLAELVDQVRAFWRDDNDCAH
jgi:ATP-dependent DNA helicase DinG